jgi:hypothetical protein
MQANPFTYGNPISDPARFFGRRREIEQIFSRLRNAEFESSSVVGEYRTGKTSLFKYISDPTVVKAQSLDPERFLFLYDDLSMLSKATTPTRFWQRLLRNISRKVGDPDLKAIAQEARKAETIDTYALADFFDIVDEQDWHIVLLLDEFENVTTSSDFGPDFFTGLRSLAIHHRLALITSSRRELIDLSHSDEVRCSPFFNIFANINLRLFTQEEAEALISKSLQGTGVDFTSKEETTLFQISGHHPFFLQAACHFLFEAHVKGLTGARRQRFWHKEFEEEATPHFMQYWGNSDEGEKILLTVLTLLEQQGRAEDRRFGVDELTKLYTRSEVTLIGLDKRGLLLSQDDQYRLFSTLFSRWVIREMTDTAGDEQTFEEWLSSSKPALDRFSSKARNEVTEVLSKIGSQYRDLVINWLADPRNIAAAVGLLRVALNV